MRIRKDIREESSRLLFKCKTLDTSISWLYTEIEKYFKLYNDDKFGLMEWEEREGTIKKLEELNGRLNNSIREFNRLEIEMEGFKNRVNKKYGREVIKFSISSNRDIDNYDEEDEDII